MHYFLKYYVSGHTAKGYVNFLSTNLDGIQKVIILHHPSNTFKTKILKKLMAPYEEREQIEVILSSLSDKYIEGIIIRNKSIAVLDENVVTRPLDKAENVNLEEFVSEQVDQTAISEAETKINDLIEIAYDHFHKGIEIHDDLEKVYINEMDFQKADQVAEAFILNLLKDVDKKEREIVIYERLFGTNTSDGVVNVVKHLLEPIKHRVYIKGRAGTGKSVFMKKVSDACKDYGLDIEMYRCSLDPDSIDMLIIRDLDYCLFDSTDPHEFFPSRPEDKVIDFYEKTVSPGTDEKYASDIKEITGRFKREMKAGANKLKEIKSIEEKKEKLFSEVSEEYIEKILQKIIMYQ